MSRNANLAKDFAAVHIEPHIEQDQKRITVKLGAPCVQAWSYEYFDSDSSSK